MLPPHLIYEISVLLSPKDLIKLSLCSKYLRRFILGNQSIWRIQYYKEWPAFFTSRNSDEDTLFPAPTWLQTFIMRKLSVFNVKRQKVRETPWEIDYQFIQDLYIHYNWELNKLAVYKNIHQKVVEYDSLPASFPYFYARLNRSHCGDNLFVHCDTNTSELYCFSLDGKYTCTKVNKIYDIFSIDKSRFVGIGYDSIGCGSIAYSCKIGPNMEIQQQDISPIPGDLFVPIHQKPGFLVSVETNRDTNGRIRWYMYDFRQIQSKLVMEKEIPTQYAVTEIRNFVLADPDYIFIPFASEICLFIYIYSFKEDRCRVIEIDGAYRYSSINIFYDSVWNNSILYNLDYFGGTTWIHLSGTSLDSFAVTTLCHINSAAKNFRFCRKTLLVMADDALTLYNIQSGSKIWVKECDYGQYLGLTQAGRNDKHFICGRTLYDFSPETPPEIQEWLYKLFE